MHKRDYEQLNRHRWDKERQHVFDHVVERVKTIWGVRNVPESIDWWYDDFYFQFERGWAVGCNLTVAFKPEFTADEYDGKYVAPVKMRTEITWSSTRRSVAESIAAIKLYTEVTQFAAELEAFFNYDWLYEREIKKPVQA